MPPALPLATAAPDGLRRPRAELRIGGASPDEWAYHLVACEMTAGLLPHVDRLEVTVAARGPAPALDDAGEASFGYEDASTELVFSGQVVALADSVHGLRRVTLSNGGALLARTRAAASYEQQSAGDVVGALASLASAAAGTLDAGLDYPFLAVDERSSLADHVARLARTSGFLAHFAPDGTLQFHAPPRAQAVQSFTYGVDVLGFRVLRAAPVVAARTAIGEGAAGSQGQDAWSWLLKDPAAVTASAGQGSGGATVADPALRTAQSVQGAADGAVALGALAGSTGELLVPGAPAVQVGSVVEIASAPVDAFNGQALVTGLHHRFVKHAGFTSRLRVAMMSGGGLGALGGLGGLP